MATADAEFIKQSADSFHDCMECVHDSRMSKKVHHPLHSVLFLVVCAVLADADGPSDIETFGKLNIDWLSKFCDYPNGIPSHDTISRILGLVDPDEFQVGLLDWYGRLEMEYAHPDCPVLIAIDGKTVRGSASLKAKGDAIHIVSAWASEYGLSLGQTRTDDKSNEINAIPDLLDNLDISGGLITADAMACQRAIAERIIDEEADYTLAVKGNQPNLELAIREYFEQQQELESSPLDAYSYSTHSKGHGRTETRMYHQVPLPETLTPLEEDWSELKSIGQAITLTIDRNGKETSEVRYYISSREADVYEFERSVRNHWSIESMHWVLDVAFHEDGAHIRKPHEVENMSMIRKLATSILKRDTSKGSLKGKRKKAGWNTSFLEQLLFFPA